MNKATKIFYFYYVPNICLLLATEMKKSILPSFLVKGLCLSGLWKLSAKLAAVFSVWCGQDDIETELFLPPQGEVWSKLTDDV